jgi:hypothetical protein
MADWSGPAAAGPDPSRFIYTAKCVVIAGMGHFSDGRLYCNAEMACEEVEMSEEESGSATESY